MINTNLHIFQYKLSHILYLNEKLYKFARKIPHFARSAWKNLKAQFKLSLDAATTTFFPKCINNPSNYTTEYYFWIY